MKTVGTQQSTRAQYEGATARRLVPRAPTAMPSDDSPADPSSAAGSPAAITSTPEATPTPEGPTDHDLIRRAQSSDEDAFRDLVTRWERRAFRVARNMVPSDEDARDLSQEAFLRVFKSLDRFDFKHEFSTWLYRIVTNLCIDHLRKRRPTVSTSIGAGDQDDEREWTLVDEGVDQPSEAMERQETVTAVRDCISALAPHFQSVLVLRELEGLPCTEIAEIVGATHVTVRWRLHRGRKLFQEEWERRERVREAKGIES